MLSFRVPRTTSEKFVLTIVLLDAFYTARVKPCRPTGPGGGPLSDVRLENQDQDLTLGLEGRLALGKRPCSAKASNGGV
jgi:hypothetical protein